MAIGLVFLAVLLGTQLRHHDAHHGPGTPACSWAADVRFTLVFLIGLCFTAGLLLARGATGI